MAKNRAIFPQPPLSYLGDDGGVGRLAVGALEEAQRDEGVHHHRLVGLEARVKLVSRLLDDSDTMGERDWNGS